MAIYYGKALKAFQENIEQMGKFQNQELSETDSRSKIIDPFLKDILQWEEENITREPHINAGYIDYFCNSDENSFVLEAKSTKIDFKSIKSNKIQYVNAKKLEKNAASLYSAIEQARDYAKQKNSQFFVVSNGLHLTISKTFLSGEEKNDLMILDGEKCLEENLNILLDILSPYNNGFNLLLEYLDTKNELRNKPQFKKTLLKEAYYTTSYKGRNVLAQPLADVMNRYFEDISEDIEILDKIYCNTSDLDGYSKEMRTILKGRVSMLGLPIEEVQQIETSDNQPTTFGTAMTMKRQDKQKGHLFIIFGNLGAGKTTFLSRYYNHILTDMQRRKFLWILIDFQSFYGDIDDVDEYIVEQIEESIYEKERDIIKFDVLKKIYSKEIERMVEGAWAPYSKDHDVIEKKIGDLIELKQSNKKEHIDKCLSYLMLKDNYEVCMVFDNLDQHSGDLQEKVSLYAVTRTKTYRMLAIVSLRDETYWALKRKPPLNAYGNITSYQVVSPSMEQILLKRINYVLDILGKKTVTFDSSSDKKLSAAITMNYSSIFSLFKDTIQQDEIKVIINNLSSGDIRKGLSIFKEIITSGHVDLNNIFNYPLHPDRKKTIPYDKVLKAIGLADQTFYDSNKSAIMNLFRTNLKDGFYSHFINFRILEILENNLDKRSVFHGPEGYVSIEELLSQLNIYCNDEEVLRELLVPFLERSLVESDIGARRLEDKNYYNNIRFVRITLSGLYHKNVLIYNHQYLEMVLVDTPIHSPETYESLKENYIKVQTEPYTKKWRYKFEAVKIFLTYLKEIEEEEMVWIKKNGITHFGLILPNLINKYHTNRNEITKILQEKKLI